MYQRAWEHWIAQARGYPDAGTGAGYWYGYGSLSRSCKHLETASPWLASRLRVSYICA